MMSGITQLLLNDESSLDASLFDPSTNCTFILSWRAITTAFLLRTSPKCVRGPTSKYAPW